MFTGNTQIHVPKEIGILFHGVRLVKILGPDVVAVKDLNNKDLIVLEYDTPVFIVNSGAMTILLPSYSLVKWWKYSELLYPEERK